MIAQGSAYGIGVGKMSTPLRGVNVLAMMDAVLVTSRLIASVR